MFVEKNIIRGKSYNLTDEGIYALKLINTLLFYGKLYFDNKTKITIVGVERFCNCGNISGSHLYHCEGNYIDVKLDTHQIRLSIHHIKPDETDKIGSA